jgi:hypothetical protein
MPTEGCGVVQQHWMGLKAGFPGSPKRPVLGLHAHFSSKAAPNEALHDPRRRMMNCQLHIVTSIFA